ncbi:MAG: M35 family metallo-endopeptidase [Caldimonas sp.]
MIRDTHKTARRRRIASHYEFATHTTAVQRFTSDTSAGNVCISKPGEGLAWAWPAVSGVARVIELCGAFFDQPTVPTIVTLTVANKASQVGIMLHEFTHISIGTKDGAYYCRPDSYLSIGPSGSRIKFGSAALQFLPGGGLFNADSYRCWAEDTQVGFSASRS